MKNNPEVIYSSIKIIQGKNVNYFNTFTEMFKMKLENVGAYHHSRNGVEKMKLTCDNVCTTDGLTIHTGDVAIPWQLK